ncbi:hypothetical protein [Synechococcus sp. LTW-G]
MALIAKMHPTANWLRVPDQIYRAALERNIELGATDQEHFWGTELPNLLQHSQYRAQAAARLAELEERSTAISLEIRARVGSQLEEQALLDEEAARLAELLVACDE